MICPSCERDVPPEYTSKHHLKTKGADRFDTEHLCLDCHRTIHALFTTRQIADSSNNLDSIEGLRARPEFRKAVDYIRTVPVGRKVTTAQSRERRRKTYGRKR